MSERFCWGHPPSFFMIPSPLHQCFYWKEKTDPEHVTTNTTVKHLTFTPPKSETLVKTVLQKAFSFSMYSAANFYQAWRCLEDFLGRQPFNWLWYKTGSTVDSDTGVSSSWFRFMAGLCLGASWIVSDHQNWFPPSWWPFGQNGSISQ